MLCSELTLVKDYDDYTEIKPLPCNRWSCDYCGPRRKRQLIAAAMSGNPTTFITLTANPAFAASPTERRIALALAWNQVCKKAKRRFRLKTLPFFAVVEKTQRGEPHLHILARIPFIPQKWISDTMNELMQSPIVDIRKIDDLGRAARYVGKYIGKEPAQFGKCKRYWQSRDYQPKQPENIENKQLNDGGWRVYREPIEEIIRQHQNQGRHIRMTSVNVWRAFTPDAYDAWLDDRLRALDEEADARASGAP